MTYYEHAQDSMPTHAPSRQVVRVIDLDPTETEELAKIVALAAVTDTYLHVELRKRQP